MNELEKYFEFYNKHFFVDFKFQTTIKCLFLDKYKIRISFDD